MTSSPYTTPLTSDHPEYVVPFRIGVAKHIFIEDAIHALQKKHPNMHFGDLSVPYTTWPYNLLAEREYGKYVASLQARLEEMRKPDPAPPEPQLLPPAKYNFKFFPEA